MALAPTSSVLDQLTSTSSADTQDRSQLSEGQVASIANPTGGLCSNSANLPDRLVQALAQLVGRMECLKVIEPPEPVQRSGDGIADLAEVIAAHVATVADYLSLDSVWPALYSQCIGNPRQEEGSRTWRSTEH